MEYKIVQNISSLILLQQKIKYLCLYGSSWVQNVQLTTNELYMLFITTSGSTASMQAELAKI